MADRKKLNDRARDELFSHINRCEVLQAEDKDQEHWLDETMGYLGERYPDLTEGDLKELFVFAGHRFRTERGARRVGRRWPRVPRKARRRECAGASVGVARPIIEIYIWGFRLRPARGGGEDRVVLRSRPHRARYGRSLLELGGVRRQSARSLQRR